MAPTCSSCLSYAVSASQLPPSCRYIRSWGLHACPAERKSPMNVPDWRLPSLEISRTPFHSIADCILSTRASRVVCANDTAGRGLGHAKFGDPSGVWPAHRHCRPGRGDCARPCHCLHPGRHANPATVQCLVLMSGNMPICRFSSTQCSQNHGAEFHVHPNNQVCLHTYPCGIVAGQKGQEACMHCAGKCLISTD
jgi:hypothetical protein